MANRDDTVLITSRWVMSALLRTSAQVSALVAITHPYQTATCFAEVDTTTVCTAVPAPRITSKTILCLLWRISTKVVVVGVQEDRLKTRLRSQEHAGHGRRSTAVAPDPPFPQDGPLRGPPTPPPGPPLLLIPFQSPLSPPSAPLLPSPSGSPIMGLLQSPCHFNSAGTVLPYFS